MRLRLLQAGLYSFRASRFLMIRVVSAIFLTTLALLHARSPGNPALTVVEIVAAPALGMRLGDPGFHDLPSSIPVVRTLLATPAVELTADAKSSDGPASARPRPGRGRCSRASR